jgi:tetratricopeptide (TPR) repeat protein
MQPAPVVGTQDERNRRLVNIVLSKRSLIEFCLTESSTLLSVQKYQLAFPAAFQALKFSKEVDGEKSISTVEPYLQLSQASLGLKQYSKAEEYLSLSRWIVHNNPSCSDKTKSRLYMLKGRVSIAQGNFDASKPDFADSIYFASRSYGAEAVVTSIGYFRLGDVFLAEGNVECALAYFDKVVDIWYKYLSELHQPINNNNNISKSKRSGSNKNSFGDNKKRTSLKKNTTSIDEDDDDTKNELTEENLAEGRSQLELILEQRKRLLGSSHIATGEVQYSIGLFEFFLLFNEALAETYILAALNSYELQLGANHPSTKHVSGMLHLVQETIAEKNASIHY